VIYVLYVNPRCENGQNSSIKKGYKTRIGGNQYPEGVEIKKNSQ
jgi:hypothetical protein